MLCSLREQEGDEIDELTLRESFLDTFRHRALGDLQQRIDLGFAQCVSFPLVVGEGEGAPVLVHKNAGHDATVD